MLDGDFHGSQALSRCYEHDLSDIDVFNLSATCCFTSSIYFPPFHIAFFVSLASGGPLLLSVCCVHLGVITITKHQPLTFVVASLLSVVFGFFAPSKLSNCGQFALQ